MKRINFIADLIVEEKVKLTEPSADIAAAYAAKAQHSLKASVILLEQELLEEATSMAYYGMYHEATALFALIGIKCENHAATILLLHELFGIDNEQISFAKKERIDKQYYIDFTITAKEVESLLSSASCFVASLDAFIDRMTNEQRTTYRDSFRRCYGKPTSSRRMP